MPIISLTSDYGLSDHRVASMKGSILAANEEIKIVDISHQIEAHNLIHTAYILKNAYPHFPKNTIHIIAVDSFFSKERKSILYKVNDQYFIATDNGVLSLIFEDIVPDAIYEITLNNRFDDTVNSSVLDIFIPVATHLTNGGLPEVIGRKIKSIKEIKFVQPTLSDQEKMIVADVLYIDQMGNVVTNITKKFFDKIAVNFKSFKIKVRSVTINTIYPSYAGIVTNWKNESSFHGKIVAFFNEADYLEIAIYKGSSTNGCTNATRT